MDPAVGTTPFAFGPATTIDEVIERLDAIASEALERGQRHGWFAILYRRTTENVRRGILQGRFADGPRMERLDVVFANRYLEAYERHRAGLAPTEAWRYAFARADEADHLVLQHLMLGMNAHINLDLGIAAHAICPGAGIGALESDFFEINRILAEMIDVVQTDLNRISPLLQWVDRLGGRGDEALVHAFLAHSRRAAWRKALRLARLEPRHHERAVHGFDRSTTAVARRLCPPPDAQPAWLRTVRTREPGDLEAVYRVLA